MQILLFNISQVLGIAILHSLWQGLLAWIILRMALSSMPGLSAVKKHNMAAAAMLGIAVWFIVTLFTEAGNLNWHTVAAVPVTGFIPKAGLINHLSPFKAQADRYYYAIEGYLPYISLLYITGLVVNLLKLGYCRIELNKIKKALFQAGHIQWLVDDFADRLSIRRYVRVNFSALIDVPCMIGYLKPIILLPISLAANLSVAETEAILLHELAHIKRNDYLINLLQQVINSLLFFNPFAQIISRLMSAERENCCDDLVVQTTNNPLVYARALLKLEESRQNNLQLVLAASTKKHYLLTRIERIMKTQQKIGNVRHLVLAILLLAGSLSSIAWLNPEIKNGKVTVRAVKPSQIITDLFTDTTHRKVIVKTKEVKTKPSAKYKEKLKKERDGFDFNYNFDDKELDKLSADVQKQSEAISKYYDGPEFKALAADMEKRGKEMDAFYNSDRMKQMTADQQKISAEFQKKWGNNADMELNSKLIGDMGNKVGKYFSSPEFKEMNARLKAKYGIKNDYNDDRNDPNYKSYQAELQKNLSPEIKKQTEEMKQMGEKMRGFYQSDEFVAQRDKMQMMGDSIRRAFNNPAFKAQQADMRKLSEEMRRKFSNNPDLIHQKKLMQEAADKMHAYMQSPAFKKKMAENRKNIKAYKWDYNYNFNGKDSLAHPEKPEAPEAPEAQ